MKTPDYALDSIPMLSILNVLVVDDQPATLEIISDMLKSVGINHVTTTSRPGKALNLLRSPEGHAVDVILCDWSMPGMSGLELLRQVRAVRPELPFFMVTGSADVSSVVAAKDCGVTAYIRKPFSAGELHKKLMPVARLKAHRSAFGAA